MSTSTATNVVPLHHSFREVEQGISLFTAIASDTGSTGSGTQEVQFNFNPGSTNSTDHFIAITRVGVTTSTAAPTGNAIVLPTAAHFDRYPTGISSNIATVQLIQTFSATDFGGNWYGWVNLGQGTRGVTQTLRVVLQEINTMVSRVTVEGVISDHPISGRWWLSA